MKLSIEELEEELIHQQEMLRLLRRRHRELERQAAQYGLASPPHITTELNTLNDQIRDRETEIAKLETLSAESDLSLAEAEYRVLLAEGLDKSNGRITYLESTRLESARLRSGLLPERAQQLEEEVRRELCEEAFFGLGEGSSPILNDPGTQVRLLNIQTDKMSAPSSPRSFETQPLPSDDIITAFSSNLTQERARLKKHVLANSSEDIIERNKQLIELTKVRAKRLFHLERQKVVQGEQTPPHVLIEIEELRADIATAFNDFGIDSLIISASEPIDDVQKKLILLEGDVNKINQELKDKEEFIEVEIDEDSLSAHLAERFRGDIIILDRCIRLDHKTTVELIYNRSPDSKNLAIDLLRRTIYRSLKVRQNDRVKFEEFFAELSERLKNAPPN